MSDELLPRIAEENERLWRSARPSAAGLRHLARTVLTQAGDADSAAEFFRIDPFTGGEREAVLARSLTAARAIAWMAVRFISLHSSAEWLAAAALIADAGRLQPRRPVAPAGDPSHTNRSAALAAGLAQAPAALPRVIARHHERCDGTGFPSALTSDALTTEDRLLAAAVRFAELLAGDVAEAARRLHEEARRGAFDPELTANLLWSLTGGLPADGGFGRPAPRLWGLTDRGRLLRLDAKHGELAGPHFGVRSRAAGLNGAETVREASRDPHFAASSRG